MLSMMIPNMTTTLSIMCRECRYTGCPIFIAVLSLVVQSIFILSTIMLSNVTAICGRIIMPSVFLLSIMVPSDSIVILLCHVSFCQVSWHFHIVSLCCMSFLMNVMVPFNSTIMPSAFLPSVIVPSECIIMPSVFFDKCHGTFCQDPNHHYAKS
jgi:hypothetical protein